MKLYSYNTGKLYESEGSFRITVSEKSLSESIVADPDATFQETYVSRAESMDNAYDIMKEIAASEGISEDDVECFEDGNCLICTVPGYKEWRFTITGDVDEGFCVNDDQKGLQEAKERIERYLLDHQKRQGVWDLRQPRGNGIDLSRKNPYVADCALTIDSIVTSVRDQVIKGFINDIENMPYALGYKNVEMLDYYDTITHDFQFNTDAVIRITGISRLDIQHYHNILDFFKSAKNKDILEILILSDCKYFDNICDEVPDNVIVIKYDKGLPYMSDMTAENYNIRSHKKNKRVNEGICVDLSNEGLNKIEYIVSGYLWKHKPKNHNFQIRTNDDIPLIRNTEMIGTCGVAVNDTFNIVETGVCSRIESCIKQEIRSAGYNDFELIDYADALRNPKDLGYDVIIRLTFVDRRNIQKYRNSIDNLLNNGDDVLDIIIVENSINFDLGYNCDKVPDNVIFVQFDNSSDDSDANESVASRFSEYRKLFESDDEISEKEDEEDDSDDEENKDDDDEETEEMRPFIIAVHKGDEEKCKDEMIDAGIPEDNITILVDEDDNDDLAKLRVEPESAIELDEYLDKKHIDLEEKIGGKIKVEDEDSDDENDGEGDDNGGEPDDFDFDNLGDIFGADEEEDK